MKCETPSPKYPDGATGTYAGWRRHKRAKEEPCEECMEAEREYSRQLQRRFYHRNTAQKVVTIRRRHAKRNGVSRSPYSAKEITDTFGTTCYLCNHEVDLDLGPGTPFSPTVSHLVPLRFTTGPGDQLSNVRWSHKRCDERKGKRTVGQCALPFPYPKPAASSQQPASSQPAITKEEMSFNG